MAEKKHDCAMDGKHSVWIKTPTANLLRYAPKGSYYIRARIRGQILRESLKTTDYKVACARLSERMRELRAGSPNGENPPLGLVAALRVIAAQIRNDPSLKASTRKSYAEELDSLLPGGRAVVPLLPFTKLRPMDLAEWWARTASAYAPQRANHLLNLVRRALAIAMEAGAIFRNPARGLKSLKIPRTRLHLPTLAVFRKIVRSVREQGKARSSEAADWIEFMGYSGLRPAEIAALTWADIDAHDIHVHGGAEGTKNRSPRVVPIIPPMADLLRRMRRTGKRSGPLFRIKKPRNALQNACRRVGAPRLRIYDLRHVFASKAAECVDVPTLSRWLGHRDGGALAMKTYIHGSDAHSREAAKLVTFK